MTEGMDQSVGEIICKLKNLKLYDNTIIFFFSDNGGSLGPGGNNGPLRKFKGWLYEGGIRVPLIIRYPPVIGKNITENHPVSSYDFYPTILELAGINATNYESDGRSLVPLFQGEALSRNTHYWHYPHYSNSGSSPGSVIREGDFKLIEFLEDGRVELYNLKEDIGETNNLAEENIKKAHEMREKLLQWRNEVDAKMPVINPRYSK